MSSIELSSLNLMLPWQCSSCILSQFFSRPYPCSSPPGHSNGEGIIPPLQAHLNRQAIAPIPQNGGRGKDPMPAAMCYHAHACSAPLVASEACLNAPEKAFPGHFRSTDSRKQAHLGRQPEASLPRRPEVRYAEAGVSGAARREDQVRRDGGEPPDPGPHHTRDGGVLPLPPVHTTRT